MLKPPGQKGPSSQPRPQERRRSLRGLGLQPRREWEFRGEFMQKISGLAEI